MSVRSSFVPVSFTDTVSPAASKTVTMTVIIFVRTTADLDTMPASSAYSKPETGLHTYSSGSTSTPFPRGPLRGEPGPKKMFGTSLKRNRSRARDKHKPSTLFMNKLSKNHDLHVSISPSYALAFQACRFQERGYMYRCGRIIGHFAVH